MEKMPDMGYKDSPSTSVPMESKGNSVSYPHLSLYRKVPEYLMAKDVGETCHLTIEVRVRSKGMNERDGKKNEEMELDVLKMAVQDKNNNSLRDKLSKLKYT